MAKSAQQIIRESVRRILKEGIGDTLSKKLFGTEGARTDLYNSTLETWLMNEAGYFKFVFTPSPDKSKLTVAVTAVGGADSRVTSDIESSTDAAIKTLAPADWSDITGSWEYKLPAGVEYKKDDEVVIPEAWARIAGLLTEAADRPAAEAAVKKYLAGGHKDIKAAEQALATALAAAGFDEFEEIEELLSRHMEGSEALARDLVKLLPKKK